MLIEARKAKYTMSITTTSLIFCCNKTKQKKYKDLILRLLNLYILRHRETVKS